MFFGDLYNDIVLLSALLFLGMAYLIYRDQPPRNLPPGLMGIPILGYLPFLRRVTHFPRYVESLAKELHSDVIALKLGPSIAVYLNSYSAIKEAFSSDELVDRPDDIFYVRYISKRKGIICSSGRAWRDLRRFTVSQLRSLGMGHVGAEATVQEEIDNLADYITQKMGKPFDPAPVLKIATANIVAKLTVGERYSYEDKKFLYMITRLEETIKIGTMESALGFIPALRHLPGDPFNYKQAMQYVNEIHEYVNEHIIRHKRSLDTDNVDDFQDAFLEEQKKQDAIGNQHSFTDEQLMSVQSDLFHGGTDTASNTLAWGLLLMVHYPQIQEKVHNEIDRVIGGNGNPSAADKRNLPFTEATVLEIHRYATVAPTGVPHSNMTCDVTFRGYTIPRGSLVVANMWAVHHDPDVWEFPEDFYPGHFLGEDGSVRNRKELIQFCLGRRQCPAEELARMEVFLIFLNLMQKFTFSVPSGAPLPTLVGECRTNNLPKTYEIVATSRY